MSLEDKINGWSGPSSANEQDKQDRTERMIREAVQRHKQFENCNLRVYVKGSYANNTNVKLDSDVDVAIQCREAFFWDNYSPGTHSPITPYSGPWTHSKLRSELKLALEAYFPGQVDSSGSTAFRIKSSTARVDADVVPCFDYHFYLDGGGHLEGSRIFKIDGSQLNNYPDQQLENGRAKNSRTNSRYKNAVRAMKRMENEMVELKIHREVPSYFIECLAFNCPDSALTCSTWTETMKRILFHIWNSLEGNEPSDEATRWLEVNGIKYLFHGTQEWTRQDGREFAAAAWNFLGLST